MRPTFIIPARDKKQHVEACARSVLAQTIPCEIYFSDQGSEDGTRNVLAGLLRGYDGHHRVHLLDCPDTEKRGMPGLNAHLAWLHRQIDGEIIIMCSADDLNHPERAAYTVRAFEAHGTSYVNTSVQYLDPSGEARPTETSFPDQHSRKLGAAETIRHQIGSCGSSAWARDLWEKHGPLVGYEQQDMILPCMALMERGIYFIDLPLHTYIKHSGLANTGFQGQIAAATSDEQKAQLVEKNNFAHVRNWTSILARWQANWPGRAIDEETQAELNRKIAETGFAWAGARENLYRLGLQPI